MLWGLCSPLTVDRAAYWMAGLAGNREHGDRVVVTSADRIAAAYNQILDTADGEPVVLLHDDTQLQADARQAILDALETADVVGVVGSTHVLDLAWWKYGVSGGVAEKDSPLPAKCPAYGPVEAVDGLLLALSSAAIRLRFDESYDGFHGYDMDFCFQARMAGLKVATVPIPVVHQTERGWGDREAWRRANRRFKEKWGL